MRMDSRFNIFFLSNMMLEKGVWTLLDACHILKDRGYDFVCNFVGKWSDIGEEEYDLSNKWLTSPYCQIEPAMAFQLGLPVLILREKGVIAEGILEKGVLGVYMPEFDLNCNLDDYFKSKEWIQIIQKWEGYVRKVVDNKGKPPMLY